MAGEVNPLSCGPTERVPQLEQIFRDLADLRERTRNGLTGAASGAVGGVPPVPITLAPAGASPAQQYAHYERILASRGFRLDPSGPTVLAIRGLNANGAAHETRNVRRYDDTMVVLKRDAQGRAQVTTLGGSTHAGASQASIGGTVGVPDVSVPKDHKADVGMLDPGEYNLVRRADHNGAEAWDVRTLAGSGAVPGVRDTNQDGKYSEEERAVSHAAGHTMTGVMIHQGAQDIPQSAGCLNLSSNSTVYPEFVTAVGDSTESRKLIVLDANQR